MNGESSKYIPTPEELEGFAVEPKVDCPHIPIYTLHSGFHSACQSCQDKSENWQCLHCNQVYCSRYINGHMKQHIDATHHAVCLSFSDLSVWCYQCDDYITHKDLEPIKQLVLQEKFK